MKKEIPNAHLFNFEDLHSQAETYLGSVRQTARQILAKAVQEAETQKHSILLEADSIRTQAREEGFQEGLQRAFQEIESRVESQVQTQLQKKIEPAVQAAENGIFQILEQCADLREDLTQSWERAFMHLVSRVAKIIIRRELKADPQIATQWIREMLELCSGENSFTLELNPEDAVLLKPALDRIRSEFRQLGSLEVKLDPMLARGDCILRSENGTLDQRLDVQLARIEEELHS
ncbi:MAG: hypothetical protein IJD43_15425 [Thermoguttaceae bacterium]|nr:hypothetical protein [Thermoguttaceae bacterium]